VLVVLLALVLGSLGLAGTAYGADLTTKQVKKIAAKVVKKQAPKLSVKHAKTADSATKAASATTAGNATNLAGKPATTYLDRVAYELLTSELDNIAANDEVEIMNPTQIDVPAGVEFIHVTATASFEGGSSSDIVVWPMLDSIPCIKNGVGWNHRQLGNTTEDTSVAVNMVAQVDPGQHGVRLCVEAASAGVDVRFRSLAIRTVAANFNG
jgi:hypothetical protein